MPPKKKNNEYMSLYDVSELLKTAKDQLQLKEDLVRDYLLSKDIQLNRVDELYEKYPDDTFNNVTDDSEISKAFNMIAGEKTLSHLDEYETDREESRFSLMKLCVQDALDEKKSLVKDRADIETLSNDLDSLIHERSEYMTSEKYDRDLDKRADEMVDRIVELQGTMVDDASKDYGRLKQIREYEREATVIRQRYTLEFMYGRLDDPRTKNSECERLMKKFFSKNESGYIMKRYSAKCEQLGVDPKAYQRVLNIEEKFLEPEFHVYNNFYLFFVVSYMAYVDVSKPREGKAAMRNLLCLVDNKFSTPEAKDTFISTIRAFLQRFADYKDAFEEKNITHPNHPHRIEKNRERENTLRARIISDTLSLKPDLTDMEKDKMSEMTLEQLIDFREGIAKEIVGEDEIALSSNNNYPAPALQVNTSSISPYGCVVHHETEGIGSSVNRALADIDIPGVYAATDHRLNTSARPNGIVGENLKVEHVGGRGMTKPIVYEAVAPEQLKTMESQSV